MVNDALRPRPQKRRRLLPALVALVAVAALLWVPVDWSGISRRAVLVVAGVRQPAGMADFLHTQLVLQQESTAVSTGPPAAPAENEAPIKVGDSTSVTVQAVTDAPPPAEDGTGGKVYERKLEIGDVALEQVVVQNRSGKAVDIPRALATSLSCRFEATDAPQVLIIHTHTTEEYLPYAAGYYNAGDRRRDADNPYRVTAVGEAVIRALAAEGIAAVQDTTVHDAPKYSGAYSRSAETVAANLEKYPFIKVVLDLHRDAIMEGETGLVKPTVTVNGRKAAQMMLLVGVVGTAAMPNPYWEQNLALAAQWQKTITDSYPGLMRPLSTVASRYNQHLHGGYLLAEIGAEGNSIDEAVYSGEILGTTLAKLLKG